MNNNTTNITESTTKIETPNISEPIHIEPIQPQKNIYIDFEHNVEDFTNKYGHVYVGLRSQLEKLRQKYGNDLFPSIQDGDDIVEFFRDIFFPNEHPQKLMISNLTLSNNKNTFYLLIRPAIILPRQELELPRGLLLALKVNYQTTRFDKLTQTRNINESPQLVVQSIIDMPYCDKRDFEKEIYATVFSQGKNSFWKNNIISPDFIDNLPPISQQTQNNLS
ncbi:MAG: hypothetical protein LBI18_07730, partial [Planctomycetaceae bacterium]|nr:hypothetical protein [Planctomycetaceae bacterium]